MQTRVLIAKRQQPLFKQLSGCLCKAALSLSAHHPQAHKPNGRNLPGNSKNWNNEATGLFPRGKEQYCSGDGFLTRSLVSLQAPHAAKSSSLERPLLVKRLKMIWKTCLHLVEMDPPRSLQSCSQFHVLPNIYFGQQLST